MSFNITSEKLVVHQDYALVDDFNSLLFSYRIVSFCKPCLEKRRIMYFGRFSGATKQLRNNDASIDKVKVHFTLKIELVSVTNKSQVQASGGKYPGFVRYESIACAPRLLRK